MEIKSRKTLWWGVPGSHPIDHSSTIRKFLSAMRFWNYGNRLSISDLRKHGWQHFKKPIDRTAPFSQSKIFENYGILVHMLWLINLNKKLAPIWSLRPPLDSLIYFGNTLEYETYQNWSKMYQYVLYSNDGDQLLDSVAIFCALLQFLTLAICTQFDCPSLL